MPAPDLSDLPNADPDAFEVPAPGALKAPMPTHPPRILLLYGSLRERSFSRFQAQEAARLLEAFGAETRIFDPSGLPLPDAAPVAIADASVEDQLVTPGATLTVTGWGALWDFAGFEEALYSRNKGFSEVDTHKLLTANALVSPDKLHQVEIELISNDECAAAYKAYADAIQDNLTIADTEICAGSPAGAKDSCYGDSGGPLVVADKSGNYYQVGVVSWGSQCGNPVLPGVYNKLARFQPWVMDEMKSN